VRVVRLQNIHEGRYNDDDRVFVSKRHADFLVRHTVNPGDVLVAALGEDSYPVGRTCCYPDDLPPAINKADCYRLRCKPGFALNAFLMHFLNTATARTQVRRFEQGVTRRRTNLGNFSRVVVSQPNIEEQKRIVDLLSSTNGRIESAESAVAKLRQQKQGLLRDLLTGRVRVKVAEPASA
jgi:Restriction endonuclease S subunits